MGGTVIGVFVIFICTAAEEALGHIARSEAVEHTQPLDRPKKIVPCSYSCCNPR